MNMKSLILVGAALAVFAAPITFLGAHAETRVTYKSAKSTSSYYQMAVQLAEAVKRGSNGAMILTVEESQGSVQNVKEAAVRPGNYVFTTPPSLVSLAQAGKKMFEPKNDKFDSRPVPDPVVDHALRGSRRQRCEYVRRLGRQDLFDR